MSKGMLLLSLSLGVFVMVGASALLGQKVPPAQTQTKDSKLKELLDERLGTLRALVKVTTSEYQAGRTGFDRLNQAQRAMLHAELELCDSDKERITVLEKGVTLAKAYENSADSRFKSGLATQSDVLLAMAARLEAEIALARATSKLAEPRK